jgi:hypothetical protein
MVDLKKILANLGSGKKITKEAHSGRGQETKWEMSSEALINQNSKCNMKNAKFREAIQHPSKIGAAVILINAMAMVSSHAMVLVVSTLADSGPGSLRNQVAASSTGDSIRFAVSGTITLSSSINISHTLFVQGPGPANLIVNANFVDRAFITGGDPVFLSGMEIENGFVAGTPGVNGAIGQNGTVGGDAFGGAILDNSNSVSLILSNCWLTDNLAQGGQGGQGGGNPAATAFVPGFGAPGGMGIGGVLYSTGSVTIVRCTLDFNYANGGNGGNGGTNFSITSGPGGAGGNGGFAQGGGLYDSFPDTISIINSTVTANFAAGGTGGKGGDSIKASGGMGGMGGPSQGGGMSISIGSFYCDTIFTNSVYGGFGGLGGLGAPPGPNGPRAGGTGGGIFASDTSCSSHMGDNILAGNYSNGTYSNYFMAFIDDGFNLISQTDYVCSALSDTTRAGTITTPIFPDLDPLAQNGGGLPTFSPMMNSPIIDQGYSFGLITDERGAPRPVYMGYPEPPGGDGSDIGAFEAGTSGLGLSVISNNVALSWPAYYADLSLQSAPNLLGANIWYSMTDTPVVVGNQLVVTNRATNSMMFYRLKTR